MLSLKELPARGLQSALGGFLLCLAFASDFSYPALNTYLISYMRSTGRNPGLSYSDFLILSNCKVLVQGLSMPLVGALTARLGCTASLTIGSTIYCAGFLLTFLTCQSVFPLAVLSLASHGLAFSFCYATAVGAAMQWFPARRRGLAGSIVLSGYGFGSLLWVPAMTFLVNPDNVAAQVEPGCSGPDCQLYFTDPTLLARVPNMFLVLGSVFAALCLAAVLLISEPAEGETDGENEEKIKEVQRSQEDTESIPPISREPYSLSPNQVNRNLTNVFVKLEFFDLPKCILAGFANSTVLPNLVGVLWSLPDQRSDGKLQQNLRNDFHKRRPVLRCGRRLFQHSQWTLSDILGSCLRSPW